MVAAAEEGVEAAAAEGAEEDVEVEYNERNVLVV